MRTPLTSSSSSAAQSPGFPRLLSSINSPDSAVDLEAHVAHWGALRLHGATTLLNQLDESGLRGHGGAWFPVGRKWRAFETQSRRPVVVANGAEGEPMSLKDQFLLTQKPHLVLDGASLAAAALNANRVVIYVPRRHAAGIDRAVRGRKRYSMDPVAIEVITAPEAFLSGQESAIVRALNEGLALPKFVGVQSVRERGVGNRPTLVQNVETLAHVAMISRYGGRWFRSIGTPESPGTMLLTISGRWAEPVVVEAPLGVSFRDLLNLTSVEGYWAALLGGYGGGWVPMARPRLRPHRGIRPSPKFQPWCRGHCAFPTNTLPTGGVRSCCSLYAAASGRAVWPLRVRSRRTCLAP